ncbi:reverse transcriptase [Trichonephila clavipes]|nr:reverse transcriptase [Trichonephila clavipes]
MAEMWPYSGSEVMLEYPEKREPTKKLTSQPEVPLTLRRAKSIISPYIDNCTAVTQKYKSLGKSWETLGTVGPIPRHLERAETVARFHLNTRHEVLGVHLH